MFSIMISARDIHNADAAEEAIPLDNGSLVRIRIDRINHKILELGLQTQEDILYMEQAADAQKTDPWKKSRGMDPYAAITDLQTETVNELHEEATSLLKQMKVLALSMLVKFVSSEKSSFLLIAILVFLIFLGS
jgi:hypothetical protein